MRHDATHRMHLLPPPPAPDRSARTLRATVVKVRFAKAETGFAIVTLASGESAKGTFGTAPAVGLEYEFTGAWKFDGRFGWTFDAREIEQLAPTTAAGVVGYLRAHAPWVGDVVARRIVAVFGDDALATLKKDPARVAAEVRGITLERAKEIQQVLVGREEMERVEVAVREAVAGAGVTGRQVRSILDRWGKHAAERIAENPYRLIAEIEGIGWATADRIAIAAGIDPRAEIRLAAGVDRAILDREDQGDTCVTAGILGSAAAKLLAVPQASVDQAIDVAIREGRLVTLACGGVRLVARAWMAEQEAVVAETVAALLSPWREPAPAIETEPEVTDPLAFLGSFDERGAA